MGGKARELKMHADASLMGHSGCPSDMKRTTFDVTQVTCKRCLRCMRSRGLRVEG